MVIDVIRVKMKAAIISGKDTKIYHVVIENYFHTPTLTNLKAYIDGPQRLPKRTC